MIISERKQQILESSKTVFAKKGFYGSSSKELAQAAGISESLLYKHFPTKESLFRSTIEEAISYHSKSRGEACLAPTMGQTNFLRNTAKSILRPDEHTFRLLLFAYLELDESYLKEFLKSFELSLKSFLKDRKQGTLKQKDFEKIFTGCLAGLKILYPKDASKLIDATVQLMLNGLCR